MSVMTRRTLWLWAALAPAACFFDPDISPPGETDGLTSSTPAPTSGGDVPTGDPDETGSAVCGDFDIGPGEECDNGAGNNGGGATCKEDCTVNECGDGYLAPAIEGCDDGNKTDDDGCSATCMNEGCGDGVTADAEECDDGNSVDTDSCTNLCHLPICGDGIVNGGDECDDPLGNADSAACTSSCKDAVCGDGLVHAGVEACDDGNAVDGDECSNACAAAGCGDGVVQMGEDCDLGASNSESGACLPSCQNAACGDGFVLMDGEECDDGNLDDGDGCSSVCQAEACGNGVLDAQEECDDGNFDDTDDCRNTCQTAACGDMVVAVNATAPEECDDGNADNNDACLTTCKNAKCGDGFVFTGEECDDGQVSDTCGVDCKRSGYWVFVTSTKFDGNDVMDLANADMICTMLAANKPIDGVYRAWLGDSSTTAAERLFHSAVRYILPNKAKIADDWSDLTDGGLDLAITRNESGLTININNPPINCQANTAKDAAVWTGAMPSGSMADANCNDWNTGQLFAMGQAGLLNRFDASWSGCQFSCDTQARLYCIEQPGP